MRIPSRCFVPLLSLCLAAGACSDLAEPQFSQVAGIYTLEASEPVQMRIDPRSHTTESVTSATLDLQPIWRFHMDFRAGEGGHSFSGSYTHSGTDVVLDYDSGDTDVGTFSGDRLTITRSDGAVVVFRKVPEA
jgi:hypothetical protein